jgi:two-component system, OmpR family, sensor histidine kinase MtrB
VGRRRIGLRARTAAAFGLTALVLAVTLAALAYGIVRRSLLDERESAAMRQGYTNARLVRSGLRGSDADIPRLLSGLQVGPGGYSLLQYRQRWFASSVDIQRDAVPRRLLAVVEEGHAARQKVRIDGEPFLVTGVFIGEAGATYFEFGRLTDVGDTLDVLASSLAVAGAGATVVAVAVGISASGALLRPLRRMATVARRIVRGDLGSRLDAAGDSDLAPLVTSFNEMLDNLRERIEQEARFASDVSHELRAPLTALAAAVSIVDRRREELPETVVMAVDVLASQVHSFNRLVLDLLEISRFDAGAARLDLRSLPLADFLRDVLEGAGHGDVPIRTGAGTPRFVSADPRRLQQVLTNLTGNADHYAGGVTEVEVDGGEGSVTIAVCDRGPGIAPHEREAIFGRFARGTLAEVPGAPKGTGLGLALVAEHVRLHDGRVWVEDRPGGGSRFVVELPAEPR